MSGTVERRQSFEQAVTLVIRIGLRLSAVLLALGLALKAAAVEPAGTHTINAGLMVLLATPPARVIVSLSEHVRARDWLFAATAAAVLVILIASVVSAMATR